MSAAGHDLAHEQCLTGIQRHIRSKQNSVPRDNGRPLPESQLFQQPGDIFCPGAGKLEFGAAGLELNGDGAAAPFIAEYAEIEGRNLQKYSGDRRVRQREA